MTSAAVAVFPAVPAGFGVAGLGTAATVGIVAGGAAVVGGGAAIATGGGSTPPTTTPPVGGGPTTTAPPATTLPPTTTTTTLAPFNPVFNIIINGAPVPPDATVASATGTAVVQFDMCPSTGPLPLTYNVDVRNSTTTAGCFSQITFTTTGYTSPFRAEKTPALLPWARLADALYRSLGYSVHPAMASAIPLRPFTLLGYQTKMRLESKGPSNDPKAARDINIVVF